MNNLLNPSDRKISIAEIIVIVGFSLFPLFFQYPYRVNIFLSWEGAYRLYLGQVPYKDFGLPMGFAYWVIPAVFFKIFGPYMFSLVKAQVFINLVAGFSFRSLLKQFDLLSGQRFLSVLLFCLSYSFFNFWPWYNHSVFVYELVGLFFVTKSIFSVNRRWSYAFAFLGGFFVFVSFFTKQDGGALALLLALAILGYQAIGQRKFAPIVIFIAGFAVTAMALVLPFLSHGIGYWFNYGQPPHYSRVSMHDMLDEIFGASQWAKFYLVLILIIGFVKTDSFRNIKGFFQDSKAFTFFLLTCGILVQALIIQVTSYTPPDNNIYFHSFAFAYLITLVPASFNLNRLVPLGLTVVMLFFWWSGTYYKYVQRIVDRVFPRTTEVTDRNIVSRHNFMVNTDSTTLDVDMSEWKSSGLKAFSGVYMPVSTIDGINRLLERPEIKGKEKPLVLNMTELTPLAHEIGYELETPRPLWYHRNVAMFDREVNLFCDLISKQYYDVVLFEDVAMLNNFYPYAVQDCLKEHYDRVDTFLAPRRPTNATIEVYVRKKTSAEATTSVTPGTSENPSEQ
jgi:hypothetical protein